MNFSRRNFLQTSGGATLLATAGCDQIPKDLLPFGPPAKVVGPFTSPSSPSIDLISHALNRLTFGAAPGDYERVQKLGATPEAAIHAFIDQQLAPDKINDAVADYAVRRFETLTEPIGELFEYKEKFLLEQLTRGTLLRVVLSERQLYEVMVQFWSDHFNIDPSKGDCRWLKTADDREVIRRHALGFFPNLLRASALSPAMLWYLDGRVNRKRTHDDKPNENYARELLELHTLGVHGGYTQRDVMEVARCLTGWHVRSKELTDIGAVEFNPKQHDNGAKEVLGETIPAGLGEKDLDRVLEIVALHPSTAQHIATKLCRRFIADEPPAAAVKTVAEAFTKNQGDIPETLRSLFSTEEFSNTRGNKFKRPFNYIVSALRATGADTDGGKPLIDYLLRMGHAPFHYPTPDGYPEVAAPWMATLLWRWNFAVSLSEHRIGGTRVNREELLKNAGGEAGLIAHLFRRTPTAEETEAYRQSGNGLALLLASPAFQKC